MFIEIYKCKMCGENIQKRYVNEIVADIEVIKKREQFRHFCKNGNIGISEFIGFKKSDNWNVKNIQK